MLTYNQVNRQYGLTPEFYNLPNREAANKRSGYPLRPEMIESMMYLYKVRVISQFRQLISFRQRMTQTTYTWQQAW
jgi:hypothetical protein